MKIQQKRVQDLQREPYLKSLENESPKPTPRDSPRFTYALISLPYYTTGLLWASSP